MHWMVADRSVSLYLFPMAQVEVYRVQPGDVDEGGARATLRAEEAHHLTRVRRANPGDRIILIDGRGSAWDAVFVEASKHEAICSLGDKTPDWREPQIRIALGLGILKGDRFFDALDQAVQTGVHSITPLTMRHSIASWSPQRATKAEKRAVNAAKQTGRGLAPSISHAQHLQTWCIEKGNTQHRYYCDPEGEAPGTLHSGDEAMVLIGPEGGLHEDEIAFLKEAGWIGLSLGPRRLRSETAVPVALTLLHAAVENKTTTTP